MDINLRTKSTTKMHHNNKILVIDDDPGIRESYQIILTPVKSSEFLTDARSIFEEGASIPEPIEEKSYELHIVDRGDQGIRLVKEACARNDRFAVAFIDMKMPGIDGSETSKQILQSDPDIKIVIVTAYSEKRPTDITQIIGRDDIFYLRKPFNPEEIRQFARALTIQWDTEQEKKLLAQQLTRVNAELADINKNLQQKVQEKTLQRLKSEKSLTLRILTSGILHEIKNPMSLIYNNLVTRQKFDQVLLSLQKLYAELVEALDRKNDAKTQHLIDAIRLYQKRHQVDLILNEMTAAIDQSYLGLQRMQEIIREYHKLADQKAYGDINQLIESALRLLQNEVNNKVEIVREFRRVPLVFCFPLKLSQALYNLLLNAIEAIPTRGRVTISTRQTDATESESKKIGITISDTGAGIPEAQLSQLFDPCFTTKPAGQGSGLGLAIVWDIIELHAGEIHIESAVGVGTTVRVLLPVEGG